MQASSVPCPLHHVAKLWEGLGQSRMAIWILAPKPLLCSPRMWGEAVLQLLLAQPPSRACGSDHWCPGVHGTALALVLYYWLGFFF